MTQKSEGPPGTTQINPTMDDVRQRMQARTAESYSSRVREKIARTNALKGHGRPLGGAPPLDPTKMAAASLPKPNFESEEPPREVHEPPEGTMTGVGAAYNVNRKIARGETESPVSRREAGEVGDEAPKPLSDETLQAMKMAQEAIDSPEMEDEVSVSTEETKERLEDSEEELVESNPFDFGAIQRARAKILSDKRRRIIEERLAPLQLEDMIVNREITQTVTILPNKLSITLRTFNQREHLFCLRYVYKFGGSQLYVEEFLNTCKMVCSMFAVNGAPLPDHRIEVGKRGEEVDEKRFEDKMYHISSFPVQMLADFSVQMIWFNDRVNDLLSLDNLKNG